MNVPREQLVTFMAVSHRDQADLVMMRLQAGGVRAMVAADDEGGLSPGFYRHHRVRVVVAADDLHPAIRELDPDVADISISQQAVAEIVDHMNAWAPLEACGLVAVAADPSMREVVGVYCLENIDRSPTRFTVSPTQHFDAMKDAEAKGWIIGGSVHSHPKAEAIPSQTDIESALDPRWLYFIVGPVRSPLLRCYEIAGGVSREVPVRITAADSS